jgi:hypothetical protein
MITNKQTENNMITNIIQEGHDGPESLTRNNFSVEMSIFPNIKF